MADELGDRAPPRRGKRAADPSHKPCNCKNSRCLKLYCECFATGNYCADCHCKNCHNNTEHDKERKAAVEAILVRNPDAFRPKIQDPMHDASMARHNKGCNCKKTGCLKNYCECFQAGILCSDMCRCLTCKNYEGSAELHRVRVSSKQSRGASQPVSAPMVLPSAVGGRVLAPGSGVQRLALQAAVEETMQLQGTRGMATALCNAAFANVPVAGESNAHAVFEMQEYAVLSELHRVVQVLVNRAEHQIRYT